MEWKILETIRCMTEDNIYDGVFKIFKKLIINLVLLIFLSGTIPRKVPTDEPFQKGKINHAGVKYYFNCLYATSPY